MSREGLRNVFSPTSLFPPFNLHLDLDRVSMQVYLCASQYACDHPQIRRWSFLFMKLIVNSALIWRLRDWACILPRGLLPRRRLLGWSTIWLDGLPRAELLHSRPWASIITRRGVTLLYIWIPFPAFIQISGCFFSNSAQLGHLRYQWLTFTRIQQPRLSKWGHSLSKNLLC